MKAIHARPELGRRKDFAGEAAGRRRRRTESRVTTITGETLPRHHWEALPLAHARCGAWIRRRLARVRFCAFGKTRCDSVRTCRGTETRDRSPNFPCRVLLIRAND